MLFKLSLREPGLVSRFVHNFNTRLRIHSGYPSDPCIASYGTSIRVVIECCFSVEFSLTFLVLFTIAGNRKIYALDYLLR